ncbi:HDOD domain-containing protein [Noviherbaspirillum sp. CPCC 100848]|uniref:HDOD domain-containing protein n=1 Tax=Noviherbaspirillum album TaxID=3080276 RepID=A0ABU6JBE8_9BURK|nr:HDOD domain-containing protein [Noviherbaspirillum sp. CPCC 100848]MEC4720870.1 HDOD domain-containing protein [Noviherbaspirillum sp. CPCC 100848]
MSISVTFSSTHSIAIGSDFFMARRPVVDRGRNLIAHELLFRQAGAEGASGSNGANGAVGELPASASVIADVIQYGMTRVLGDLPGMLCIDGAALENELFTFLPADQVTLVLTEMPGAGAGVREQLAALRRRGFRFALAVTHRAQDIADLLDLIDGVRIDVTGRSAEELSRFCAGFRIHHKKLLAERVDTPDQFDLCASLGFDAFQGYFFTTPRMEGGAALSPTQAAIMELLEMLASDAEDAVIEHKIKADIALGLNLLRLANTPAISTHRIDSLRQAMKVLGRNQLQRWLQLMLYADHGKAAAGAEVLARQATTRGRLMELLAHKTRPGNRGQADTAFTIGIMSLMDTLFSMPMTDILEQIPVAEEVSAALLRREGYFGRLLDAAEYTEWRQASDAALGGVLAELQVSCKELYLMQLLAFEWSDEVAGNFR